MALLSPTTNTPTTTTLSSVSRRLLLSSKPSQLSAIRPNQAHGVAPRMISCNASKNDDDQQTPKPTTNNGESTMFDRRNMLIGFGGLYGAATVKNTVAAAETAETTTPSVTFPKPLDHIIRTNLPRPITSRSKKEKEDEEEVLIIEVESKSDVYSKFDVYVNDEDEAPTRENRTQTEYAGSFVNVPHKHKRGASDNLMKTSVKFGLTELIDDLGADDDDGIDVIFVPRTGTDSVVIKDVRIEFLS